MSEVNELAINRTISFTADLLADPLLPRDAEYLNAFTNEMMALANDIEKHRQYLGELEKYFLALHALSQGDESESIAKTLDTTLAALKDEPFQLDLTPERQKAISGQAALVSSYLHAKAVENALRQSAAVVSRALLSTDHVLRVQSRKINFLDEMARTKAKQTKVERPFLEHKPITDEWQKNWSESLRQSPTSVMLEQAQAVSRAMQDAWVNLLQGETSLVELRASMNRLQNWLELVHNLRGARPL
jgi:hypothetical protein